MGSNSSHQKYDAEFTIEDQDRDYGNSLRGYHTVAGLQPAPGGGVNQAVVAGPNYRYIATSVIRSGDLG